MSSLVCKLCFFSAVSAMIFQVSLAQEEEKVTCAVAEEISKLSDENAIEMAYNSGLLPGNFAFESEPADGLLFISETNARGNLDILALYPELNKDIVESREEKAWAPKSHYNGIFKPTYLQYNECRRQVLITGVNRDDSQNPHFTGWINVEICNPEMRQLFSLAADHYGKNNKKMESIDMFLEYVDVAVGGEKAKLIRETFSTSDQGIYYAKVKNENHKLNGHIGPRFSVPIVNMMFEYKDFSSGMMLLMDDEEDGKNISATGGTCFMKIKPSSPYAGLLEIEKQYFSNSFQEMFSLDPPIYYYFNDEGKRIPVLGVVNESLLETSLKEPEDLPPVEDE